MVEPSFTTVPDQGTSSALPLAIDILQGYSPDKALKMAFDVYLVMRMKNSLSEEGWKLFLYDHLKDQWRGSALKKMIALFDANESCLALQEADSLCQDMTKRLDKFLTERGYLFA